jgi:hypothetical protein
MNQSFVLNSSSNSTLSSIIISTPPLIGFTWATISRTTVIAFSILTNFINITVFVHPKLKDPSYTYMLVIAVANFFYSSFSFISNVTTYCVTCLTYNTYFSSLFSIYFANYASAFLAFFRITVECTLSLNTLYILTNNSSFRLLSLTHNSYKYILPTLLLISAALYSFVPFAHYIGTYVDSTGNNTQYTDSLSDFYFAPFNLNMGIAVNALRLSLIVL